MKILVIGAAGRTGRHVIAEAARRGHAVTTLARPPHDLRGTPGVRAHYSGDAADPRALAPALAGQDAVVMAVGASSIVRTLLSSMPPAGVRRLVMTSSRSVVATRPRPVLAMVWLRFRSAYADLARAEGMLEGSGLDWTIVRATMLSDGPATGQLHKDSQLDATGGDWRLRRADYAIALLDALEDDRLVHRAIGVSGATRAERHAGPSPAPAAD
ncbi:MULTISPECIES: NAD(P)-dependent oxidoreductase [unclassified Pseudactinotalea]|uniref:NAD(P)-dependent oxidoreductase n=1 Tax=unclassified Pseudactinotalea TaxID=2649176 RepID=UPI00128B0D5C|nr:MULTISPECIES: NAD(P)H-binding protein [unclassified Pseudactinotalea]MPV51242.1 NAD(P)H-binding protein [Pseudactinotalea sp. HY160]QGH69674.1 NAD(P)H-binding protein [Pseudactinotalea sp. HY158]